MRDRAFYYTYDNLIFLTIYATSEHFANIILNKHHAYLPFKRITKKEFTLC